MYAHIKSSQNWQNNFWARLIKASKKYWLVSGDKERSTWVYLGCGERIFHFQKAQEDLNKWLQMEDVVIPKNLVFFEHGRLMGAGPKWKFCNASRSHFY